MTAKEYLSQAYRLDQRIDSNISEITRLREMACGISSPSWEEKVQTSRNTDAPFVRCLEKIMADSVTGGGLHGKDLSKADVSVNIYAFLKAQETGKPVTLCCAIGDDTVDGRPYAEIVEIARNYIHSVGGFERFAEWGLV